MKRILESYDYRYELSGYIDAILFTEDNEEGEPLERNYDSGDFDRLTKKAMVKDIEKFMKEVVSYIEFMMKRANLPSEQEAWQEVFYKVAEEVDEDFAYQIGIDFWLTRNGHGTGFWDQEKFYGELLATTLNDICKKNFKELYSYVGEDGLIYVQ
jgi:hypothetical protein